MTANELMIGDLLRVTKDVCIKKGTIVRVRAIDADDTLPKRGLKGAIRCQPIDDEYGMNIGGVWLNFLEPIPLTAEILEKNGFKKVAGDKYFPIPRYVWIGSEESECVVSVAIYDKPVNGVNVLTQIHTNCKEHGGVNRVHNCDICYVHKLQQALRLCGIDKTIEI